MKKFFLSLLLFAIYYTLCASVCFADENHFLTPDYFKRFAGDIKELPSKPFRWTKGRCLVAGGIAAGTLGAFAVDADIRRHFQKHRSNFLSGLSDAVTHFGDYKYQLPLLSAAWLGGMAFKNEILSKIAADGAEASFIAAGMITPLIVYVSGRALPNAGEHAMKFKPFTPGRYSFPSGHTTAAFALAATLDVNLRGTFGCWHTPVVYGIALGVAQSRIYDHKHYLSDVILGAGIGWSVGYWIAAKPRNLKTAYLTPTGNGLQMTWRF